MINNGDFLHQPCFVSEGYIVGIVTCNLSSAMKETHGDPSPDV